MNIYWLNQANQDLLNAFEWIRERNPKAAKRTVHLIYQQIKQLKQYPQLGRQGQVASTRELVIQQTRYIVVYRLNLSKNCIEILALMHESQQWPEEL